MQRYAAFYQTVVARDLQSKFLGLKSMTVPKFSSIDLCMPIEASSQILPAMVALELLSGQKGQPRISKVYGPRENAVSEITNTLRKDNMYAFYDNLINVYLPTLRKAGAFDNDPYYRDNEKLKELHMEALLMKNVAEIDKVKSLPLYTGRVKKRYNKRKQKIAHCETKITLTNLYYLPAIEREFHRFSVAGVKDLRLDVTIKTSQ